jgi:hypothetical protein
MRSASASPPTADRHERTAEQHRRAEADHRDDTAQQAAGDHSQEAQPRRPQVHRRHLRFLDLLGGPGLHGPAHQRGPEREDRLGEQQAGEDREGPCSKFSLTPSDTDRRRVLAVLRYLGSGPADPLPGHPGPRSP